MWRKHHCPFLKDVKNVTYTTATATEVYNGLVINILVCVSFSSKSCIDHAVGPSFGYLHALLRISVPLVLLSQYPVNNLLQNKMMNCKG